MKHLWGALLTLLALGDFVVSQEALAEAYVSFDQLARNHEVVICSPECGQMKGLIIRPVVEPHLGGKISQAEKHFDARELDAMKAWGANTGRILVDECSLDPRCQDRYGADPGYFARIGNVVSRIRAAGLAVIIGINAENSPDGYKAANCMPTDAALRAWGTLLREVPALLHDPDHIILELYNEPVTDLKRSPEAFSLWAVGGEMRKGKLCSAAHVIGMDALIQLLRRDGATNLLIADGLGWAHYLDPNVQLTDPLNRIAYGVHPFLKKNWPEFTLTGDPAQDYLTLDQAFGYMATVGKAAVVVTAVGGGAESGKNCVSNAPDIMRVLLDYLLIRHHMGAVGWAFDQPHTLTSDWDYDPTSYDGFQCPSGKGVKTGGPGILLRNFFQRSPF